MDELYTIYYLGFVFGQTAKTATGTTFPNLKNNKDRYVYLCGLHDGKDNLRPRSAKELEADLEYIENKNWKKELP